MPREARCADTKSWRWLVSKASFERAPIHTEDEHHVEQTQKEKGVCTNSMNK